MHASDGRSGIGVPKDDVAGVVLNVRAKIRISADITITVVA